MATFRSFRLRIALLTAVVAGIIFGVFSIAAYSIIHSELERNLDTRIIIEARGALGKGLREASETRRRGEWMKTQRRRESETDRGGNSGEDPEAIQSGHASAAQEVVSPASIDAVKELEEGARIFASNVAEIRAGVRQELYRSSNWPSALPAVGNVYGPGEPIPPTEVNDLLSGRRPSSPKQGDTRDSPRTEPRRETINAANLPERRARRSRSSSPRQASAESAEQLENQPDRERERNRRRRWGFILTEAPHFHYRAIDGESWRVGVFTGEWHEVLVAASLADFNANVQKLRSTFAVAVPAAVILIALGAWLASGQAIRPIRRIADTAEGVTTAGLSQRIAEPGTGDELQRLTTVLNRMLDRLEDGFKQATRFSADASHELKTPLTIMQGELENALRSAPPGSKEQGVFASQLEEVTRLKRIVASLLLLSRADAGQLNLTREPIDISRNVADICEDAEIMAEAAGISLKADVAPDLQVLADRPLLQQVFQNLISNAVKYNEAGGSITCQLKEDASTSNAVFEIKNTGPGIPPSDREKIFRRFHRADAARGRGIDGFGLGLNLAQEIAQAHDGTLELVHPDETATTFRLTIPLATSS